MAKSNPIIDTNVLIRFLTNNNQMQAEVVETFFSSAAEKSLHIPDVVIVETVFVLLSVYELEKEDVIEKISILITFEKFSLDRVLLQKTIEVYGNYAISFVDAYVAALATLERNNSLYTFDKKLLRMKGFDVRTPGD